MRPRGALKRDHCPEGQKTAAAAPSRPRRRPGERASKHATRCDLGRERLRKKRTIAGAGGDGWQPAAVIRRRPCGMQTIDAPSVQSRPHGGSTMNAPGGGAAGQRVT